MPAPSPSRASTELTSLPRWIRVADAVTVALIGLALAVAIGGGFRERLGGIRIAVTSPWGLLVGALVIGIVRHLTDRRRPLYERIARRIVNPPSPASQVAWSALLATRPVILCVGFCAVITFGYAQGQPAVRYSENEFVNLQGRLDASWYVNIATNGYEFSERPATEAQSIVFFPAFPMAVRVAGRLFGGGVRAYLFGGTAVSLVAFFWALFYFHKLATDLLGSTEESRAAVLLLATYPFAVFYGAVYSESLFLLGAVAAFYHMRRREYGAVAAWGLLVGLTRPNGSFLTVPLVLIALRAWVPRSGYGGAAPTAADRHEPDLPAPQQIVWSLASASTPVLGLALYSTYVWRVTGNPLAWLEGHVAWGRTYAGLLPLLHQYYSYFHDEGFYMVIVNRPYDLLNAVGALFVLALAIPVWRRLGLPYAAFVLLNLLPPLAAGGFLSAGRLSAVIFPAFLYLAAVIPATHRVGWMASFMAIQGFNAALFYTLHELF